MRDSFKASTFTGIVDGLRLSSARARSSRKFLPRFDELMFEFLNEPLVVKT